MQDLETSDLLATFKLLTLHFCERRGLVRVLRFPEVK